MPSGDLIASGPLLSLEPSSVVLSGLKTPEDGTADEVIVRVYEATGNRAAADLFIKGARAAWHSDLPETRGSPAECVDERVRVTLEPFEIKTLRIGITRRLG
jgi:alpha-mannosidase